MKTNKIVYWVSTVILSLMMINSAVMYFSSPEVKQGFTHLGFPDYFRVELGVLKLIGAILLLAPVGRSVKEWTYSGFAITFLSAFIAHTASGDPVSARIMPLVFLFILAGSYITFHRKTIIKNNYENVGNHPEHAA